MRQKNSRTINKERLNKKCPVSDSNGSPLSMVDNLIGNELMS